MKKVYPTIKSVLGLGFQLAKAKFKLRNEGSFLGIFWYLLEPFLLFLIILVIRGAFKVQDISNYPLYLLLGLIMYNFFTGTTSRTTEVITGNSNFIKNMRINHESLVLSQVLESVFSHFFEVILFIIFMIFFNASLITILFYPLIFIFFFFFILGLSFILATIGVYINDLGNIWRVFTRFLFFLTPLFYVVNRQQTFIYVFNLFNPLFHFINISREIIIYKTMPGIHVIIILALASLVFLVLGIIIFEKFKNKFAERV